jgi:FtsP/CotA-like multicopper oxidase with cupredoxin domain
MNRIWTRRRQNGDQDEPQQHCTDRDSNPCGDESGRTATHLGFKDTVLIWPGETVRWAVDFSHGFEGEQLYMFHCHILEHENAGMMLNFKVLSGEA